MAKGTPPLALTCGDPAGVGPEIIASWLAENPDKHHQVCVLGPASWLETLGLPASCTLAVGPDDYVPCPGKPDTAGWTTALAAMETAAAGTLVGRFSGVVTGPINKAGLHQVGFKHPGQTEFFAERWGGDPVMAFTGGRLRVVLVTWHVPLAAVPGLLSPSLLERSVRAAAALCESEGLSSPKIAVCGLNPHAGEEGILGTEERDLIGPVLAGLRAEFPGLTVPLPGDTVFGRALRGDFDVVIAMYHDQGLAPLKTVDFEDSVNVSLGLTHVRTSPDHGTAYSLAGKGLASSKSFSNAVIAAQRLINFRRGR